MFSTILIANRGEIACRISKTAREMGIKTIAIYSSADKDSLHVRMADEAYWVGEAPAKDSYLCIDAIIQIALKSNAQAIHPGYGFLSENPLFAQACEKAGLIFIGPGIEALKVMGSKQLAKQLLEKTAVPLTPGYHGADQSEARLLKEAQRIGFPVLLKAANGGGGKGMRSVSTESEFSEALAGARRESLASFADDTMIIEKLLINPRHIEVQVMADNQGSVIAISERDCSIQRRHQKIIEEAPAPNLSETLRQKLAKAAREVAKSIHYRGAGTMEFLVDPADNFYFMEMNTRLQVEHPVTEMVTGIDLVQWQLLIAAGEPLPLKQEQLQIAGHAIECRIYAEDPLQNFIPSIGQIDYLHEPHGPGIRIDSGVGLHNSISRYYDPMIAKLIAYGKDREEALQRLQRALSQYYLSGVKTNLPFLQAICKHPQFVQAHLSTNFLESNPLDLSGPDPKIALLMAIAFDYLWTIESLSDPLQKDTFAWQASGKSRWIWRYRQQDTYVEAIVSPVSKEAVQVTLGDATQTLCLQLLNNQLMVSLDGQLHKALVHNKPDSLVLFSEQGLAVIERFDMDQLHNKASAHKGQLTAPMPATVVAVLKNVGEKVKAGDKLLVLEAMKMEHTIHAPADGVLLDIFYTVGSQVNEGAELLALSESES